MLLLQSSGVGNCVNMLSLVTMTRTPLLMLVTMRGEWAEFNPWQVPMGLATAPVLTAMGIRVMRADTPSELIETVESAAALAFEAEQQVAGAASPQRLLGRKKWWGMRSTSSLDRREVVARLLAGAMALVVTGSIAHLRRARGRRS